MKHLYFISAYGVLLLSATLSVPQEYKWVAALVGVVVLALDGVATAIAYK